MGGPGTFVSLWYDVQHIHSSIFFYCFFSCIKAVPLFLFISDFPPAPSTQNTWSETVIEIKSSGLFFCTSVIILFSSCLAQKTQEEDSEDVGC